MVIRAPYNGREKAFVCARSVRVGCGWKICLYAEFCIALGLLFGFLENELCHMLVKIFVRDGSRH